MSAEFDASEPVIQHRVTCPGPDVHFQRGVTRVLMTCRGCGADVIVLGPPR